MFNFQDVVDTEVKALLALKAEYKTLTGQDFAPPGGGRKDKKKDKKPEPAAQKKQEPAAQKKQEPAAKAEDGSREVKKVTRYDIAWH